MLFGVWLRANGRIPHEVVDALSWYDAREWARGRYGLALSDVLELKAGEFERLGFETTAIAPRAAPTAYEREQEHRESIEHRAYERGRLDALESIATLPNDEGRRAELLSIMHPTSTAIDNRARNDRARARRAR